MITLGIDARPLESPRNGIGRYTESIVSQLRSQTDWRLVLYCTSAAQLDYPDCKIVRLRRRFKSNSITFQLELGRAAQRDGLDCYFSPRHHIPRTLRVPAVVTIHDMVWRHHPRAMKPLGYLAERMLMPSALRRAAAIIAVSRSTADEIADYQPAAAAKVRVIYEAAFAAPGSCRVVDRPVQANRYLLAVGTQEPRKNYYRLVEAFADLAAAYPELRLVIVGGSGWGTDLAGCVAQHNLEASVELVEDADDALIRALYEGCEFLVQPSLYEGFCLPLVEAMAAGKPVVTSNCSAMPEITDGAAWLVDPLDVASITSGMRTLLNDAELRARLAGQARVRARDFSWSEAGRQTIEVIARAAGIAPP